MRSPTPRHAHTATASGMVKVFTIRQLLRKLRRMRRSDLLCAWCAVEKISIFENRTRSCKNVKSRDNAVDVRTLAEVE